MTGYLQERDGSRSSRRLLAVIYAIASLVLFGISALRDAQWAFWGGVACTVASIVYPILTTAQEIQEVLSAAKGLKSQTYEGEK
jgi:hypothetical protein